MAERKPLSLNERNNRLLQGLSQSRSGKPSSSRTEVKVRKVKLQGRRRLCRLSTETEEENPDECWLDLDSPPKQPERNNSEEQVRDILSELTARLECLSVEKTKATVRGHCSTEEKEHESEEFGSANSSLSPPSILCISDTEGGSRREGDDKAETPVRAKGSCGKDVEERLPPNVGRILQRKDVPSRSVDPNVVEEWKIGLRSDVKSRRSGGGDGGAVSILDCRREDNSRKSEGGDSISLRGTGSSKSLTYTLPAKLAKILYPHQRDGLKWLWSLHCGGTGGILGDDMGLGKTMQISCFLSGLFHSRLIKRALIVAPKTLLSHWAKELSVTGLANMTKNYYGTCSKAREYELKHILKNGGVLLTTYDIVRNNFKSIRGDVYFSDYRVGDDANDDDIIWNYVILDEGHFIKNPNTQRAKALLEIPSTHRIIISGTPIQNNLKELWALFNFCCPEVLGDKHLFKEMYEYKILRGNEKNASDREKHIGSTAAKELRDRIKPFFLRRLKSEVFAENDMGKGVALSKKNEIIVWLKLTECQRQLYEAFLKSDLVNFSKDAGSPLAALTVLKKICDHPLLLTKRAAEEVLEGIDAMLNRDDLNMAEEMALSLASMTEPEATKVSDKSVSCKTNFLLSLLDNLLKEGHSVLVFSQTRKMLNLIQDAIIKEGYEYLRIDGTTKASDREKIVNDFQGGQAPIFLLTSQVGGLGLTLTRADRVIVVDPAWNPSMDNQSVDRAYRIGQKKDVLVYRLMTCGTIEEKIYKKQVFKGGLFRIATEQKEQTRYFSQKDLQELFSLPKEGFDISLTQQQLNEEHDWQHTMDETLQKHVQFLERQGIAGVSDHSLLFSKTASLANVPVEDNQRTKGNVIMRSSASTSTMAYNPNGMEYADYAFNPKDVKSFRTVTSMGPINEKKRKEEEIEEKIMRLSRTLANEAVVHNLPDKGEKIRTQIIDLRLKLSELRTSSSNESKSNEAEVINLDDLADEMERVLSV